jgi:hypothetical protein
MGDNPPNNRLSPKDVTGRSAVKIVVKHAQSGAITQFEVIIFCSNLTNHVAKKNTHAHVCVCVCVNESRIMKPIRGLSLVPIAE